MYGRARPPALVGERARERRARPPGIVELAVDVDRGPWDGERARREGDRVDVRARVRGLRAHAGARRDAEREAERHGGAELHGGAHGAGLPFGFTAKRNDGSGCPVCQSIMSTCIAPSWRWLIMA